MNYYPPVNKDFEFPQGELPALVGCVWAVHGVYVCVCVVWFGWADD